MWRKGGYVPFPAASSLQSQALPPRSLLLLCLYVKHVNVLLPFQVKMDIGQCLVVQLQMRSTRSELQTWTQRTVKVEVEHRGKNC